MREFSNITLSVNPNFEFRVLFLAEICIANLGAQIRLSEVRILES